MGAKGLHKTRHGHAMNEGLRARITAAWSEPGNERITVPQMAKLLKMSVWTLRDYMTPELRAEVEARRRGELTDDALRDVDRAMLAKACAGNIMAARLVYARMAQAAGGEGVLPTLEELEAELNTLKQGG